MASFTKVVNGPIVGFIQYVMFLVLDFQFSEMQFFVGK